ncbi:EamA family transporter RarD [Nocardioides sp. SYSU D00038]|uniref:EamA family transporter RarD n=1 Tax=Nocardioides sp. SYSU D00038 TaxID=2812554 RepID=UPI001967A61C|nr:EamA family transporter RarD [Nocardioides sp. SYSU D00038]
MSERRRGLLLGATAYVLWGGFPLYFPLLEPAGAVEILAHRVAWSALTMGLLVVLLRRTGRLRALVADRRRLALLTVAAVTISFNWGTYIYGVTNDRVVEASLGYFINPLVTVLMGVLILRERLRPLQWVAMGVATAAVVVLTLDYGRPPWVALVLAFSFGTYGLAKKSADAPAVESLTLETLLLLPLALGYIGWAVAVGESGFGAHGLGHALLFTTTGVVTAVPLVCFGAAATRVPMVTLGLLQYLAPILQFGLGVLWFHEQMGAGRWTGFGLVWLALAVFTVEAVRHHRRQLRLTALATSA